MRTVVVEVDTPLRKERRAFPRRCPLAGRVGVGCEFRLCGGRSAEGFVVQRVKVFAYSTRRIIGINLAGGPVIGIARVLLLNIRADQAGVDREALTTNQAFLHATRYRRFEQMAQQIAFAEPTMTVLGKGRVIRDPIIQIETAEME